MDPPHPGLIVSGVGLGFIEPPLASTAIGVVQPQRAGMASGINVTFRQAGISVGIALLGTLFASRLGIAVTSNTAGTSLHPHAGAIAMAVRNDHINTLFRTLPHAQDGLLVHVLRASHASALNEIILVGAIITFVGAVLCFVLIRRRTSSPRAGMPRTGRARAKPAARAGTRAPGSKTAPPPGRGRSRALRQAPGRKQMQTALQLRMDPTRPSLDPPSRQGNATARLADQPRRRSRATRSVLARCRTGANLPGQRASVAAERSDRP